MLSKIDFYALVKPVWLILALDLPECDCVLEEKAKSSRKGMFKTSVRLSSLTSTLHAPDLDCPQTYILLHRPLTQKVSHKNNPPTHNTVYS